MGIRSLPLNHVYCIAPMLGYTDRHFRYLVRLLSKEVRLYTEMVAVGALLHGKGLARFLAFHESEHPIALQLGGNSPCELVRAAKIAQPFAFDEINLNAGCPSPRVQAGRFGAALMLVPDLLVDCAKALVDATEIPVSVKMRLGVNDQYAYEDFLTLNCRLFETGVKTVIIHARIADLERYTPKENRDKPPLSYETVYRLKRDLPDLNIVINGNIVTHEQVRVHLTQVDGVMLGREVIRNPYLLSCVDQNFFGSGLAVPSRDEVLEAYLVYVDMQAKQGIRAQLMLRHAMNLFKGQPCARQVKQRLSRLFE